MFKAETVVSKANIRLYFDAMLVRVFIQLILAKRPSLSSPAD